MKKRLLALLLCTAMVFSVAACGKGGNDTETEASGKRSGQFDIDPEKQVKKLADYASIEVTVPTAYEVNASNSNSYLSTLLSNSGLDAYKEIKDRDTVKKSDYVKVDYTGYKDDEAFDGGAATDVLIDVKNNCSVGANASGFIEGFTDDLAGAKVGDTIKSNVTFPENYSSADLAGQAVVFEFKIKAIYDKDSPLKFDDLTDKLVKDNFSESYGLSDVKSLKEAVENQIEQQGYSQTVDKVKTYMIENSEVEIPEDYFQARLKEYQASFEKDNCGTESLEDYLKNNYNTTVDQAVESWKTSLTEQIKLEFIFKVIADKEKIEMNDDDFKSYIDYIISASNGSLADSKAVYKYFGAGNEKEGKKYLETQYLVNKAIDKISADAKVTYKDEDKTEE